MDNTVGWTCRRLVRLFITAALWAILTPLTPAAAQGLAVLLDRDLVAPGSTLNLGNAVVGVPKDFTFTLGNVRIGGSGSLQVTNVGITGAAAADYDVLTSFPITIAAERTADVRVRLTASAAGQRRAAIAVKSSGTPNPYLFDVVATASNSLRCEGVPVTVESEIVPAIGGFSGSVMGQVADNAMGYRFQVGRTAKYRFSICGVNGDDVTPGMSLCLLDSVGALLAKDDGSCTAGGEIVSNLDPGTFVIAVSGPAGGMFHLRYGLTPLCDGRVVDFPAVGTSIGVRPTVITGSVSESLAAGRRFSLNESRHCVFSLCREGGSASFDSRLCLFNAEGKLVAEDDGHCGAASEIDQQLDPGSYVIAVSGDPGVSGSFSLAMFIAAECAGVPIGIAGELSFSVVPQVLNGSLAPGEAQGYVFDAEPFDVVQFSFCRDGGSVTFDSNLCILGGEGDLRAQNDDLCGVGSEVRLLGDLFRSKMVVITARQGGGEYALSYFGSKFCSSVSDDTTRKGELTPTLEQQTASGSVNEDRENLWLVRIEADGVYAFTFCEPPGTFVVTLADLCLYDAAGSTIQRKQPCPQGDGNSGLGEIRTALAAGDYALSIGESSISTSTAYTLVYYAESISPGPFRPCDFDCSGSLTITDPIATLGFLFLGDDEACCPQVADCNSSGTVDIGDAIFLLTFLFNAGRPPEFFPGCGGSGCTGYPCDG